MKYNIIPIIIKGLPELKDEYRYETWSDNGALNIEIRRNPAVCDVVDLIPTYEVNWIKDGDWSKEYSPGAERHISYYGGFEIPKKYLKEK